MPTAADVYRVYIKPSLNGEMIFRKRTSTQTSQRLKAVKLKVEATKGQPSAPAKVAHNACEAINKTVTKRVYVPGTGYQEKKVCPIKEMRSQLKKSMKAVVGGA